VGSVAVETIPVTTYAEEELRSFLRKNELSLTTAEARKVAELIGRDPTLTELHVFNIEWSEHCSYKSSRHLLKKHLPTQGSKVIQGPEEDAGIVELGTIDGEKYGIVFAHESHNHPSQIVPYEGAATGIGGITRDVLCMGAKVIATADPLRFGNPYGKNKNRVRYIANAVVDGIAGYGNPLGVANLAGDISFNDSFDDNCLVNVVCLGLVKEKDVIHSKAPKDAEGFDIIVVGKATDASGFGGAAFASVILDDEQEQSNKSAVQVPDPFLKNMLFRASYAVFEKARNKGITLGFKDMGAGGIMTSVAEMCESGGYGAEIDLSKVHVSVPGLPAHVIAAAETQERFTWVSPKSFTPEILKSYNEEFELPCVAEGACARVVGKVTKARDFVMTHNGEVVCHAPIDAVTSGICYDREVKKPQRRFAEPDLAEPADYQQAILAVLHHPNVASRAKVYKHYDTEVQGLAIIRPGEADAGVQAPIPGKKHGIALSVDANPLYTRIDPYMGAVNAVAEAMRNVACVGAVPYAMTDCLNYGNPEDPFAMHDFVEGLKGIGDAARNLYLKGTTEPVPFVSGNVSFYNESAKGKAIDPSPIIACLGVLADYSKAITMQFKGKGNILYLLGERKDELGGSAYYQTLGELGAKIPIIEFTKERKRLYAVIDAIDARLLASCHDISDGGMVTTVAEMAIGGEADGRIGAEIDLSFSSLRADKALFSESSGFVVEVSPDDEHALLSLVEMQGASPIRLGVTKGSSLRIIKRGDVIADITLEGMKQAWATGLAEALQ